MADLSKIKILGLALLLLSFSGCGFHLRGSGDSNDYAQKLFIEGPAAGTSFVGVFGDALIGTGGSIEQSPASATAIIHLYKALYQRQFITLSRTGKATGYDLIYRIVYDLRTPKGEVLQPTKEFDIKRNYFNDQTLPLAQLAEESLIRQELEKEAAQMLLRRVVIQLKHASDAVTDKKKS